MQATVQDFIDTFGEEEATLLTDPNRIQVDYNRIGIALEDADAEIRTYLGTTYTSDELDRPCKDLKGITVKIARWNLDQANNPREHVLGVYQQCGERLKAIAAKEAALFFDGISGNDTLPGDVEPLPIRSQITFEQGTPRLGFNGWGD